MRVNNLQLFLRSLRTAVAAADNNSSVPADLDTLSGGLEPFATLDIGQFASFLRQAEQYRNSGAVSVPLGGNGADQVELGLQTAASLADSLSGAEAPDGQQVLAQWEKTRGDLEKALTVFLKPLGISVTLKGDKKAVQTAVTKARTRTLVGQFRAALEGVTDEASLNAPERQDKLRGVGESLQQSELKAIATELGAKATGGKDALLAAIVERITGIKPAPKKATRASRPATVDQAAVQQQAVKLKGLLEKSLDPGGLSSAEVEEAVSELAGRSIAELQAIAKEVGLEKVGKTREGILKTIREKLWEAERARESIQV